MKPTDKRKVRQEQFPKDLNLIWTFLIAWVMQIAVMYFAVFPGHFGMSGDYLASVVGAEAMAQLEAQGLTYPIYILISVIGCLTVNMILAVGEEAGWRGFLYPQLKAKFGKGKGWLIGSVLLFKAVKSEQ